MGDKVLKSILSEGHFLDFYINNKNMNHSVSLKKKAITTNQFIYQSTKNKKSSNNQTVDTNKYVFQTSVVYSIFASNIFVMAYPERNVVLNSQGW